MNFLRLSTSLFKILISNRSAFQAAIDRDAEVHFRNQNKRVYGADRFPTIDWGSIIREAEVEISNYTYLGGNSLPTDMALIKEIARSKEDTVFLEIGSWRGETLSNVAKVARRCFSLTLGPKQMKELGISQAFMNSHGLFTADLKNIEVFHDYSQTFDFSRLPEKPNLIFVDGDHTYEGVKKDTENSFSVLRDEDSVIIWHDYGHNTEDVRHSVMAGIVDGTPAHLRKHLYHVSNTMCAVFTKKQYTTYQSGFPQMPNKIFDVKLTAKPFKK